ncbi:MAG: NAD(P)H-dependent dehydrogenase/reductase [Desulfuromonas sp.]|nr:MAG: NAD(P)H-dependent dehydrogenase/reductase [Desulfuromonas sp.]
MLDLLRERRSIRKFSAEGVDPEKVDLLQEALLRAPTSRNLQPCEFVLVDDRDKLMSLATAKLHGTAFFATAPLAVVVAANPEVSDVWIEDCAIAAIIVQLAAEELGLKSCWAQLRLRPHSGDESASEFVRSLLDLPAGMEVPIVIAIGYPDENKAGHGSETLKRNKLHLNSFRSSESLC